MGLRLASWKFEKRIAGKYKVWQSTRQAARTRQGLKFPAMKLYVGVTDNDWYRFLSQLPNVDEVNFWQPGESSCFDLSALESFSCLSCIAQKISSPAVVSSRIHQ
jgi:hypothetical protein